MLIALLGFCDDHAHINSMLRLSIHFITATFIVFSLNGFAQVSVFNNLNLGFFTNYSCYSFFWFGCLIYIT
ncbi:UDP-N-acetylmuramyl pentapeptide phosphotransferase/UDP-N-acetylglucosamine-1-phosphate transferase, partial [Acinetobacter baumannii ABNIH15]